MLIDANNMITQSEANKNFKKVCHLVDRDLYAVILRYSEPRYILIKYDELGETMDKLGFNLREKSQVPPARIV